MPRPAWRPEESPFRILNTSTQWDRRGPNVPRRAAVSGFGFGGINAHLLVEEWLDSPSPITKVPIERPVQTAVAIVSAAAHFGTLHNLESFAEETLGLANKSDTAHVEFAIDEVVLPIDAFSIPPKEIEEMLPQQLLMLRVAKEALGDHRGGERCGVFIGLGLDPNTTNFHSRWRATQTFGEAANADFGPALNANRTMGALGSIAASRIARAFRCGGPSFTLSSSETSGLDALQIAVSMLQRGQIDTALVGAVDLACDPRTAWGMQDAPGDGAVALVLKRVDDARRDGDRFMALIGEAEGAEPLYVESPGPDSVQARVQPTSEIIGQCGAALGLAAVLRACLALDARVLPVRSPQREQGSALAPVLALRPQETQEICAQFWLHDSELGARAARVDVAGLLGT